MQVLKTGAGLRASIVNDIREISARDWNSISGTDHPFLRHEFLAALERHDCVGAEQGWLPQHIAIYDGEQLAGLAPLYLKDNSYGEFVFDWAWADAYHRAGLAYYPKLVSSIPYTPVTGSRLLVGPGKSRTEVCRLIIEKARQLSEETGSSSLHWLFTTPADTELLVEHGFMRRTSCHFHWHNSGYQSFDDFLSNLSSRKRKKIRRERRHVSEAGVRLEVIHGCDATPEQWQQMHWFYRSTFMKKSGMPTLTLAFFEEISQTMGDQVVLVFARHEKRYVAGSIMLRGSNALYGRHWGCLEEFNSLHFETCYYQGIEYCIDNGLELFEPGAQGEHKISRGFLPSYTWSAHHIRNDQFRQAIERYLQQEHEMTVDYHDDLMLGSPFKKA